MRRCFVFSAGHFFGLRQRPGPGDFVVAADAGYLACHRAGIEPDLVLGDFDSMRVPVDFPHVERVPVEKDDTDTLLAIKVGLQRGCRVFFLYGCTGGRRLDHTLANLHSLLFLRRHGAAGYLYGDQFVWTVAENETLRIPRTVINGLVSLFPLDGSAEGVTLTGLHYPMTDGTLTADFPLGISNRIVAEAATVEVQDGALLVGWQLPPL